MRFLLALAITLGVALVTSTGQRTRQPFQGNNCQDLPNGNYPDLDDCTKFHMCSPNYGEGKSRTGQQARGSARPIQQQQATFFSASTQGTDQLGRDDCTKWTEYQSRDTPNPPPDASEYHGGDWEELDLLRERFPEICESPTDIRVRVVDTPTDIYDPSETDEHFRYFDTTRGFACVSAEQDDGLCEDYEVSFCCP
ncbi:hypothetical protein Bbelb_054000 [Branchiostoma belcheri]|nr:hypothetical protein Bbelb_054000 [Branchiostoma belcheri]